jgi:hypothetical protein
MSGEQEGASSMGLSGSAEQVPLSVQKGGARRRRKQSKSKSMSGGLKYGNFNGGSRRRSRSRRQQSRRQQSRRR